MNSAIIKVLVAGKRLSADGPRELIPTLVSRPCLDEDEFDLSAYIRGLEEILNDKDTSDEEYFWVLDRIAFLGGTIEWIPEYLDGTDEIAFVNL